MICVRGTLPSFEDSFARLSLALLRSLWNAKIFLDPLYIDLRAG
jgi:hypothetical protein